MGFNFGNENEKALIERIFQIISVVNLDQEIANITIGIRKKSKIKLPDALIIETAEKISADLITSNISDFINLSETVRIIAPK